MKPPLSEYLDVYFPGTYTLQDDGSSCDLDECATDLHGCSFQCQNMPNGNSFVIFDCQILTQEKKYFKATDVFVHLTLNFRQMEKLAFVIFAAMSNVAMDVFLEIIHLTVSVLKFRVENTLLSIIKLEKIYRSLLRPSTRRKWTRLRRLQ